VRTALLHGFTGLVSAGGPFDIDAQLGMAIDDGLLEGPRILAASHGLDTTGDSDTLGAPSTAPSCSAWARSWAAWSAAVSRTSVVDGDPSADISVLGDTNRLRAILKGGRFVKDAL
jgi:imidazolonepropionase-like amidohydrolase